MLMAYVGQKLYIQRISLRLQPHLVEPPIREIPCQFIQRNVLAWNALAWQDRLSLRRRLQFSGRLHSSQSLLMAYVGSPDRSLIFQSAGSKKLKVVTSM
jgi:hypothetical protein